MFEFWSMIFLLLSLRKSLDPASYLVKHLVFWYF